MNSENIFGQRIFDRRKASGMTQKQLGEAVGLSMQAINDIEKGRRETTISKVVLLAQTLNTTMDYLVGETDNPSRPDGSSHMEKIFSDKESVSFISRLFSLCKENGVSMNQLEDIVAHGAHRYEGMVSYDFPSLCALADYFDVSLDFLTGRNDNPNSHKL